MADTTEKTGQTGPVNGYVLRCKKCDGVLAACVADAEGVEQTIPRWRKREDGYVQLRLVEEARDLPLCERVAEEDKEVKETLQQGSREDREWISEVPKRPQRQDSTTAQLRDLQAVANRLGMYDAADLIGEMIG